MNKLFNLKRLWKFNKNDIFWILFFGALICAVITTIYSMAVDLEKKKAFLIEYLQEQNCKQTKAMELRQEGEISSNYEPYYLYICDEGIKVWQPLDMRKINSEMP